MEQTHPSQEAQKLADDIANCIECIEQNSIVGGPIKDTIWFSDAVTLVDELHRIMERLRTPPVNQQPDTAALLNLLADIRAACGDNGKRMQDELVEHIRAGFAELELLRSQQACAQAFPERIMSVLKQVADRNPGGSLLPWEDGQGEPLQDDADAAIAWIASRSQQPPAFPPVAARKLAHLQEQGYEITGYAIQHSMNHDMGFINSAGFVGWWRGEAIINQQPVSGGEHKCKTLGEKWQAQHQAARLSAPQAVGWVDLNEHMPEPEVFVLTWDGKKVGIDWWGSLRHRGDGVTHWAPFEKPPGAGPMYGMHSFPAPPTQQGE